MLPAVGSVKIKKTTTTTTTKKKKQWKGAKAPSSFWAHVPQSTGDWLKEEMAKAMIAKPKKRRPRRESTTSVVLLEGSDRVRTGYHIGEHLRITPDFKLTFAVRPTGIIGGHGCLVAFASTGVGSVGFRGRHKPMVSFAPGSLRLQACVSVDTEEGPRNIMLRPKPTLPLRQWTYITLIIEGGIAIVSTDTPGAVPREPATCDAFDLPGKRIVEYGADAFICPEFQTAADADIADIVMETTTTLKGE
jgi:hypothetical protein|tara:strand:+ start:830 stop:1570 length:741 start_codon:yes stop_codon:yes gene_type:complete